MRWVYFLTSWFFCFSVFSKDFSLQKFFQDKKGYEWSFVKKEVGNGYTTHTLQMRSQVWQEASSNQPIWEHEIRLTIPEHLQSPYALVHVLGGAMGSAIDRSPPLLLETALSSQTILIEVFSIPNQPILFSKETKARSEDAIVAYTWRKFLETKDSSWPLHLPMARAVIRAIDSVQTYCQNQQISNLKGFVLTGESKRAWAAWLAAAADERVSGLIPISCDFLNVKDCFSHHYRSLGSWSIAIRDYLAEGINEKMLDTPSFDALMQIEDPYFYRSSYTMPKFLVQTSGDPFSPPDSSRGYYSALPSPKYLRYLPNAGHRLPRDEIVQSVSAFYLSLIGEKPLPQITWKKEKDLSLSVSVNVKPSKVTVWRAHNPLVRDFRLDFTNVRWEAEPLAVIDNGAYQVSPQAVTQGWSAFFVEYEFPGPSGLLPLIFTTEVVITPDALPFSLPMSPVKEGE